MKSKQLVKVIKTIVEAEVAKKHEQFLTKTFPKILEEEVSRRMKSTPKVVEQTTEIDPFEQAEIALQEERTQPKKQFTKNEAINEALNNTKPFTAEQRKGGVEQKSVLDNFQQPVNESMDKTVTFNQQGAGAGLEGMRANMAAQMGYGDIKKQPSKTGLGVRTGLPGLDRILNRDNSELVKKFKR
jgi:predicted transcriptional regulator|tara:strand:+ start:280 stop:834 length:555 start_codon:yes stop_codon:yes gene_type:complete